MGSVRAGEDHSLGLDMATWHQSNTWRCGRGSQKRAAVRREAAAGDGHAGVRRDSVKIRDWTRSPRKGAQILQEAKTHFPTLRSQSDYKSPETCPTWWPGPQRAQRRALPPSRLLQLPAHMDANPGVKWMVSQQQACSRHPRARHSAKPRHSDSALHLGPLAGRAWRRCLERSSAVAAAFQSSLSLQPPAQPSSRMTSPRPFLIFPPPRIPHSLAPLLTGRSPSLVGDHLRQGFWPALPAAQDWSPGCGQDTGHPPSIWGLAVPWP